MIKGYRTLIFNLLSAIIPVMEIFGVNLGLEGFFIKAYYLIIIGGNIYLRFVTNTAVGKRHANTNSKSAKK